jgi:hypothetical protein
MAILQVTLGAYLHSGNHNAGNADGTNNNTNNHIQN